MSSYYTSTGRFLVCEPCLAGICMRTNGTSKSISLIYLWRIFTAKQRFLYLRWVAAPSEVSAMATNNKLAKARKHIKTQRYGGGTHKQTCRGVESRPPNRGGSPKQQQKQPASRWRIGKNRTAGQEVQGTWQVHQEEVFWSRQGPKFPTDARCHDRHTWQTGCTQNLWYQPWYYGSIGQS